MSRNKRPPSFAGKRLDAKIDLMVDAISQLWDRVNTLEYELNKMNKYIDSNVSLEAIKKKLKDLS